MVAHAGPLSFAPTPGLTYDPSTPGYLDPAQLQPELTRAFAICAACRMCFKFCDAFPRLFDLLDRRYDGDPARLTAAETDAVMTACFQCKLCEVQCPYTPRDAHAFQLDFPALVHRYMAVRRERQGLTLRDRVLGDPDRLARLARLSLGAANVANRTGAARWAMEKTLGVHRRKLLPDFARHTFEAWAKAQGKLSGTPGGEAVLFHTCFVQNNRPELGRDALDVLERNGVDVRCVAGLRCCGMPAWEHGDLAGLRERARANLDALLPFVEAGARVLVVDPTCSMMLRREWPRLLEGEDRRRAERLAPAVMDPCEFLWSIRNEPRFNTRFLSTPGPAIAYHAPCHLRAQAVGFKGRDLLRKIPGVERLTTVTECCGHDGTFAMKTEGFEPAARIGKRAFTAMQEAEAPLWVTDCPLAVLQFEQHAGTRPLHPLTVLARAYRADGFPTRLEPGPAREVTTDATRSAG